MTETQTVDLAAWLTQIWDRQELIIGNEIDVLAVFYPESGGWHWNYGWSRDVWRDNGESGSSTAPGAPTPQEVLARIAADRKILELHSYHLTPALDSHFKRIPGTERPRCDTCASQDENGECWPCETVRLLASPYKGRDGWQEEWE